MKVLRTALLLLLAAVALFPFFVMISVSLQTMPEVYSKSLLPSVPHWENYATAMHNGPWGRYLLNSLYVTVLSTGISLLINALTGYVFARMRFPWKKTLFTLVLIGMMIPTQVTLVPLFVLVKSLPLVGGNNILGQDLVDGGDSALRGGSIVYEHDLDGTAQQTAICIDLLCCQQHAVLHQQAGFNKVTGGHSGQTDLDRLTGGFSQTRSGETQQHGNGQKQRN